MEKFIVRQSEALHGTVRISGAKNAVLPILAACLLTEEPCTITNVPPLTDVMEMAELLEEFGAETSYDGLTETIKICSETLSNQQAAEKNTCSMRASFLAAGPLLTRCHQAALPLPGGCPIGSRPVDLHLKGFSIMGAVHKLEHGVVELSAKNGLRGKRVYLDFPSVGATENIMMAATLAKGTTTIYNAACEPYLQQLCRMLNRMGAKISGIASNLLTIEGVEELHGTQHTVLPDMIEVGSFIGMAAMTKSEITIKNVSYENLGIIPESFRRLGIKLEQRGDDIYVPAQETYEIESFIDGSIMTIADAPWPGLTPDLLSVMLVVATQAKGSVLIHQKMFESRLFFVDKLIDMGAQIILCDPHRAVVIGHNHGFKLRGARLTSPDIRAGIALLIAAMSAEGTSTISNIEQIDRGYQNIEGRLNAIGARITRI